MNLILIFKFRSLGENGVDYRTLQQKLIRSFPYLQDKGIDKWIRKETHFTHSDATADFESGTPNNDF